MAGITLAEAESDLAAARAARLKIMTAIGYGTGDLRVQRATLSEINATVNELEAKVQSLSRGGISVRGAIPLD